MTAELAKQLFGKISWVSSGFHYVKFLDVQTNSSRRISIDNAYSDISDLARFGPGRAVMNEVVLGFVSRKIDERLAQ